MKLKILVILILAMMVTASCARSATHPTKRASEGMQELFRVRGEVLWKGPAPVVYPIPTTAYRGACGKRRAYELLELKKTRLWHKRLYDVAVWLEPVWEEMIPEDIAGLRAGQMGERRGTVKIVEKGCMFVPDMIVVPVGTRIEIVNEDRKDHWFVIDGKHRKREQYVQYYGETPSVFTFETPGVHHVSQGAPVEFIADKVDIWSIVSGFHRWMDAWIVITDKIWFDESVDKRGIFEITDVPRGVYRVHAWHPVLGESSSVVRVPDETRRLIAVDFYEDAFQIEKVTSTLIPTSGEVREEHKVWEEIEEW